MSSNGYILVQADNEAEAVKAVEGFIDSLEHTTLIWAGNASKEFVLHAYKPVWKIDVVYKIEAPPLDNGI